MTSFLSGGDHGCRWRERFQAWFFSRSSYGVLCLLWSGLPGSGPAVLLVVTLRCNVPPRPYCGAVLLVVVLRCNAPPGRAGVAAARGVLALTISGSGFHDWASGIAQKGPEWPLSVLAGMRYPTGVVRSGLAWCRAGIDGPGRGSAGSWVETGVGGGVGALPWGYSRRAGRCRKGTPRSSAWTSGEMFSPMTAGLDGTRVARSRISARRMARRISSSLIVIDASMAT